MKVEVNDLTKRFGDLEAVSDLSLTVEDGEFVTLVGPSGCGKTTTLRCIAGLENVSSGRILFDSVDVTDQTAKERNIAFVFQDYALYPHMTAKRNMTFALEEQGIGSEVIEKKVRETAEMLGISNHLDQKPNELSGGQQQRVALGRSIVRDPDIFLLDEPLSNLDAKLRTQMRAELQKIHDQLDQTMIYVTHDQEEAMTMSDRIVILKDGYLQQVSTPAEAYYQPENRFVAGFIGSPAMNFLPCRERADTIDFGAATVTKPDNTNQKVSEIGIRPEDLVITDDGVMEGEINVFEQLGAFNIAYVNVDSIDKELVVMTDPTQYAEQGDRVGVSIKSNRFHLFDQSGTAVYNPELPEESAETYTDVVST